MANSEPSQQAAPVVVRPARAEDKEAVLAFCADTWSYGDYIPYVWDDWLRDGHGVLLVAVVGERPVGMSHVALLSEDEAWLEGIRVDPRERRQGLGRMLVSRSLVAARDRGAVVARLITDADNATAQALFSAFGFTRVAEVNRYQADALTPDSPKEQVQGQGPETAETDLSALAPAPLPSEADETARAGARVTMPGPEEFEPIWAWLVQSNLSPLNGGLEFASWKARALTEPSLRRYLAEERVLLLEEWGTILALAILRDLPARGEEPAQMEALYVDGLSEGIGRLALVLREVAAERGQAQVVVWLPDLLILRDAMDGAGYRRDEQPTLVYARNL